MIYDIKNIWRISLPIIVSMLLSQLIGVTDVIYLGHLGTVELGAAGLGSTYFFALFVLVSGFCFGSQIIISRRNGEKQYEKIGAVFYQSIVFLVPCAVALICLSDLISPYFLRKMINDEAVLNAALDYIYWRVFGLIGISFLMMFRSFFVGIAKTFALQLISVSMVMFNVVLNYVFIFGCGFVPALGIKGAALASVFSEILAALVCVVYVALKTDVKKYALGRFVYKDFGLLASIVKLSFWTMLQQFVSVFTWFLFFIAVEHLGATELAISNVLKNSAGIPWIIVVAFATAGGTITGNLIGEKRSSEVMKATGEVIRLNTYVLLGTLLIFGVFYGPILRIYTNNEVLLQKAVWPYMTALLCYMPLFSGFVWFQNVSATGHARYSMFIEFVAMVFYMLFVWIAIYEMKMPLYICMLADGVYNAVLFVMSRHFMRSMCWMGKKV